MYVIKKPDKDSFEKVGIKGKIFPISSLTKKTQFVLIETRFGHETKIIEKESDFIYYVLQGKGYFEVDGEREKCETGDLVVIPAGRTFSYKGKLKMLLSSNPPWREEQEETVS